MRVDYSDVFRGDKEGIFPGQHFLGAVHLTGNFFLNRFITIQAVVKKKKKKF